MVVTLRVYGCTEDLSAVERDGESTGVERDECVPHGLVHVAVGVGVGVGGGVSGGVGGGVGG